MSDWCEDEPEILDTDCVDSKWIVWPDHDFQNGLTCRRCGAEAEPDDAGAVSGELAFKSLATFVMSGLLYLTYWTAANMWIMEFLILAFFDVFVFLSWSRAYARSQIRVYGTRPPVVNDDTGEI